MIIRPYFDKLKGKFIESYIFNEPGVKPAVSSDKLEYLLHDMATLLCIDETTGKKQILNIVIVHKMTLKFYIYLRCLSL